jgi:hypothetical protein
MQHKQASSFGRLDAEMFAVSVLILYLELVLIRWLGTEIRIFAYLGNLILVVCFFGVGLGCYRADRPVRVSRLGVNVLLIAVLVANPFRLEALDVGRVPELLNTFEDLRIWGPASGASPGQIVVGLSVVGLLAYLVLYTFVPAGQILGRVLQRHPKTIRAYSVNVAGSLLGVWLFNAVSWSAAPPPVWFALAAVGLVQCADRGDEVGGGERVFDGAGFLRGVDIHSVVCGVPGQGARGWFEPDRRVGRWIARIGLVRDRHPRAGGVGRPVVCGGGIVAVTTTA